MLIFGPMVVADYNETKNYDQATCSGTQLNHLDINDGMVYSHGTIQTCVVESSQNQTCLYNAELYYPPIRRWWLVGKKRKDVQTWSAGLGASQTFVCYIEHPGTNGTDGISDLYADILGWYFMIAFAVLFLLLIFGCIGYFFCEDCWRNMRCPCWQQRRETSSTQDRPAWMSGMNV